MANNDDKPDKILVPNDRIFSRGQGCWNCKWMEKATAFWTDRRQADLRKALDIARTSPLGEQDPKVLNIRNMVDTCDHAVASGALVKCGSLTAKTAHNEPIGDLVAHNYLCNSWSGATGASIAREGGKLDELPEELADKLDGSN